MVIGVGLVGGCGETVSHPISPLSARGQVVDAARDIVKALHAEVSEATFSYESCNDQGEAPFRESLTCRSGCPASRTTRLSIRRP